MVRFLFRFTGLWLVAGAFVALVIDGTRSVSASRFVFAPVRDIWTMLDAASLKLMQEKAATGIGAELLEGLLAMPFFVLLGLIGVFFLMIGRRKHERVIGYSSRD